MIDKGIPRFVDGARVICVAQCDAESALVSSTDGPDIAIVALAIAEYENGEGILIVTFDENGHVVDAVPYQSIEGAREYAESYYETGALNWNDNIS